MTFPKVYADLLTEPGPRIFHEMLKVYGTQEWAGDADNPSILWWARSIGLEAIYRHDATPWCGLCMGYVAAQAGWEHAPRGNALWALNWLSWGIPQPVPMLGDVLVFGRHGGGHVSMYVGEDDEALHIMGGNQADQVNVERKSRSDLIGARRCPWRVNQPANVRRIWRSKLGGIVSAAGDA